MIESPFSENRIIRIRNLSFYVDGRSVFSDLSATFMSNRINCLVGKNGSGKTLLLKILGGFENAGILRGKIEMNDMSYFQNRYELFSS